jgi:hypothetical protein
MVSIDFGGKETDIIIRSFGMAVPLHNGLKKSYALNRSLEKSYKTIFEKPAPWPM